MWFTKDAFHFVWKKVSGNVSLAADIRWIGTGGNPHKKACLVLRQNMDPGSAYADAAEHGEGLTSLQYRATSSDLTHEIQSNVKSPVRARIEKNGNYVSMSIARENEDLQPAGGSFRIQLNDPFYIGLGVCSHDSNVVETAVFSNIEIKKSEPTGTGESILESTLETIASHRPTGKLSVPCLIILKRRTGLVTENIFCSIATDASMIRKQTAKHLS